MNKPEHYAAMRDAFTDFYGFAPVKLPVIFILMMIQSITAGIGLLFILPLLQLVGFEVGGDLDSGIVDWASRLFSGIGVPLTLESILASYVLIVTVIASVRFQLTMLSAEVQQQYICHLRNTLYTRLLQSSWQFIMRHRMADFTHCLGAQVQSLGLASYLMLTLLSQVTLTVVMVGLAFLLSWQMSVLAVLSAMVLLAFLLPLNRRIYGSGEAQLINYKSIFQILTEQIASLKMIKSYASESSYARQLQQVGNELEMQTIRLTRMNALTQWTYTVGAVVAFSVFFYTGQKILSVSLATILLLLVIFSRLLPQLSGIQQSYQQLLHKLPAFKDVRAMLRACDEAREPGFDGPVQAPLLKKAIALQNISYQYPDRSRYVFENYSLSIKRNQTVALTGPSGAGKSTLADLIAGLLHPDKGTIYCDDVALTGSARIAWRQTIAYVTQEVFLFHDTVRANLQWVTAEPVTDDRLWEALRMAAADTFVAGLPQGLDTLIGDRGVRLSGGERQRLALARALLSKPQLLILDEATSALDAENEKAIHEALKYLHGKLTIVIIAHRETTIQHADVVVRLGGGPNTKALKQDTATVSA